jgi:hypothetical protein
MAQVKPSAGAADLEGTRRRVRAAAAPVRPRRPDRPADRAGRVQGVPGRRVRPRRHPLRRPGHRPDLKTVGKALAGTPLATTLMEGGGRLPWLPPEETKGYGFVMILYPTTVVFRVTKAIERALADLKAGKPMPKDDSVDLTTFEEIVGMPAWAKIEKLFKAE